MNIDILQIVLGWSALINYLLLTVWFVIYGCFAERIYQLHSRWFTLSREQFAGIHYAGMAILKIQTFMLFLAPWLALCIINNPA